MFTDYQLLTLLTDYQLLTLLTNYQLLTLLTDSQLLTLFPISQLFLHNPKSAHPGIGNNKCKKWYNIGLYLIKYSFQSAGTVKNNDHWPVGWAEFHISTTEDCVLGWDDFNQSWVRYVKMYCKTFFIHKFSCCLSSLLWKPQITWNSSFYVGSCKQFIL